MVTERHSRGDLPDGKTAWNQLDGLSDAEVERRARADPDAMPLSEEDLEKLKPSSRVRILRLALGMTQEAFASAFGLSVATIRDWEQGRTEPDQASRTLLKLIARIPADVQAALAGDHASGNAT